MIFKKDKSYFIAYNYTDKQTSMINPGMWNVIEQIKTGNAILTVKEHDTDLTTMQTDITKATGCNNVVIFNFIELPNDSVNPDNKTEEQSEESEKDQ